MRKSLLKDNAPLFEWLVRLFDPILAILAGVGASLIWKHRKDKAPNSSQFVSIRANDRDE